MNSELTSELTILLYHGVTDHQSFGIENFSKKHIYVVEFVEQMKWLKQNATLLSMDQVIGHYIDKIPFPKRSVAITFDDGFENNYSKAFPIIYDFKIPTTFYISSGLIGTEEMFWVDQLEDCINLSVKKNFSIETDGKLIDLDVSNKKKKIESLKKIKAICKSSDNLKKEDILEQTISLSGVNPSVEHSPNYRVMNWSQLREMNSDKNVIIGGHSLRHEILSELNTTEMKKNIKESISLLTQNLSKQINHYSYPEGQDKHYNEEVIRILKAHNIKCSPSARYGKNNRSTDLFNLYRVMVGFDGIPFPYDAIKKEIALEEL